MMVPVTVSVPRFRPASPTAGHPLRVSGCGPSSESPRTRTSESPLLLLLRLLLLLTEAQARATSS
eukprot:1291731-Rhodomonas_salina.4